VSPADRPLGLALDMAWRVLGIEPGAFEDLVERGDLWLALEHPRGRYGWAYVAPDDAAFAMAFGAVRVARLYVPPAPGNGLDAERWAWWQRMHAPREAPMYAWWHHGRASAPDVDVLHLARARRVRDVQLHLAEQERCWWQQLGPGAREAHKSRPHVVSAEKAARTKHAPARARVRALATEAWERAPQARVGQVAEHVHAELERRHGLRYHPRTVRRWVHQQARAEGRHQALRAGNPGRNPLR